MTAAKGTVRSGILDALETVGPMSKDELAAFLGVSESGVRKWLKALHAQGCIHIGGWDPARDGIRRKPIRLFVLGPGKDSVFRKLDDAEKGRRYRAKRIAVHQARKAANAGVFGLMLQQLGRAAGTSSLSILEPTSPATPLSAPARLPPLA